MDCTLGERLKVPQLPPLATVRGSSSLEISLKTCRMSPSIPFSLVAPISSLGSIVSPPKISQIQQVNCSMIWFMLNFSQRDSYSLRRRSMNCPTEIGESKSKYFFRNMMVSSWPLPSSSSNRPLRTTDESSLREDERLSTRLRECRSVDLSLAILLMAFSSGSLRGEVVTLSSMRDGVRVFLDGVRFPRGAGRGTLGFCCFCLGVSCC